MIRNSWLEVSDVSSTAETALEVAADYLKADGHPVIAAMCLGNADRMKEMEKKARERAFRAWWRIW